MAKSSKTIIMLCYVIIGLIVLQLLMAIWKMTRRHHHHHGCKCRECRIQNAYIGNE